ncbi:TetR/AcrR family transcriptional regulator [Cellulosilyticum lentocellum]|uniref:Regulatory protein TetR n=1 Tax=Cellulosilyticum lentocellum (strain ATCC 49066 / DSM 5427 / NCIMB 11756 / RHM5) TaxID=642492 RepID=F2JLZ8_CELLD|nr:TetR/AcrR family transcriptional regulator [Cellulosilyticum lentocellum]ADZ85778.1 regulatory protein TetR [Cellulosilyticum lentocellum DSM 5427]
MEKENYHHGALKEELIKNGLLLLNSEGVENFSLRKVATMCGVSHAAPYKHFKNKEEMLSAISHRVNQDFREYLEQVVVIHPGLDGMITMGKAYVRYMITNKEAYQFMFLSELKLSLRLEDDKFIYNEDSPFVPFYKAAYANLGPMFPNSKQLNMVILNMWSQVHGLASLIVNGIVEYNQDIEELVERMLTSTCLKQ